MSAGLMPWSGSRARSRDRGYADAMLAVNQLVYDLQRGPLPADEALGLLRSYTFDVFAAGEVAAFSLRHLDGWVGQWARIPADPEASS